MALQEWTDAQKKFLERRRAYQAERQAKQQAAQERYDEMTAQIAQVLADHNATCAELPGIWDGVFKLLTVQVRDQ